MLIGAFQRKEGIHGGAEIWERRFNLMLELESTEVLVLIKLGTKHDLVHNASLIGLSMLHYAIHIVTLLYKKVNMEKCLSLNHSSRWLSEDTFVADFHSIFEYTDDSNANFVFVI